MEVKGIIWAGLYVEDLAKAVFFYRDAVGLKLLRQGEGWAHFAAGGRDIFEVFSGGAAHPVEKAADRQSLSIGFQVDDLAAAMTEMQGRGVVFNGEVGEWKGSRWIYFTDPEGNRLEIKELPKK